MSRPEPSLADGLERAVREMRDNDEAGWAEAIEACERAAARLRELESERQDTYQRGWRHGYRAQEADARRRPHRRDLMTQPEPTGDNYVELTGDDIPPHLRPDAVIGICGRCGREAPEVEIGTEDRMTQPDGYPCGGRIEPLTPDRGVACDAVLEANPEGE